jgi:hypothetical protein
MTRLKKKRKEEKGKKEKRKKRGWGGGDRGIFEQNVEKKTPLLGPRPGARKRLNV